jgi:hypothetical protein
MKVSSSAASLSFDYEPREASAAPPHTVGLRAASSPPLNSSADPTPLGSVLAGREPPPLVTQAPRIRGHGSGVASEGETVESYRETRNSRLICALVGTPLRGLVGDNAGQVLVARWVRRLCNDNPMTEHTFVLATEVRR